MKLKLQVLQDRLPAQVPPEAEEMSEFKVRLALVEVQESKVQRDPPDLPLVQEQQALRYYGEENACG